MDIPSTESQHSQTVDQYLRVYDIASASAIIRRSLESTSERCQWIDHLRLLASIPGSVPVILRQKNIPDLIRTAIQKQPYHSPTVLAQLASRDKDQFIIQIPSIVETVEAVANRAACDGFEVPAFDELLKVLMNEYGQLPLGEGFGFSQITTSAQSEVVCSQSWLYADIASLYLSRYVRTGTPRDGAHDLTKCDQLLSKIQVHPTEPEIRSCRATLLEAQGNLWRAFEIRKELAQDPACSEIYRRMFWNTYLNLATRATRRLSGEEDRFLANLTTRQRALALMCSESEFAKCLSDLANRLDDLGEWDDALSITETSKIHFVIAGSDSAYMATTLHNLSIRLRHARRAKDALDNANEAVQMQKALSSHDPAASYKLGLAAFLANLSHCQVQAEREDAASQSAEEALRILQGEEFDKSSMEYRDCKAFSLAARWNVENAQVLHGIDHGMAETAKLEKALQTARDRVDLRRDLAKLDPIKYAPDCVIALNDLSTALLSRGDLGDYEEVCGVSRDADAMAKICPQARHLADVVREGLVTGTNNCHLPHGDILIKESPFPLMEAIAPFAFEDKEGGV